MIPAFVISLPCCKDRRECISGILNQLGIDFDFFDAVDGLNGLQKKHEAEIDRAATQRKGRKLSDAEYACALSHINVYRKIVRDKIPYALVFEDDAFPLPPLLDFLEGGHWKHADLIQLSTGKTFVSWHGAKKLFGKHASYVRVPCIKNPGAVAYTISLRAARHIVRNALPVDKEADWPACVDELIIERQFRCVYPPIVLNQSIEGMTPSLISDHGRSAIKERRRFLGVYVPPFRHVLRAYRRAPYKLIYRRLRKPVL